VAKSKARAAIGIDVGGTKTRLALFDPSFQVLREKKFRSHAEKGGGVRPFEKALRAEIARMMATARAAGLEVRVVGVGCAGDIDMKKGSVRSSPNLTFLNGYPFREKLSRMTKGARVFVANDVQAGLYGELRMGAARSAKHVIGVWIGTGVGGALIIDRKIYLGATGRAGDIGNYLLYSIGAAQVSPRKEVLDAVASRTAIAGEAAALAAKHRAPALRAAVGTDVDDIGAGDLARAIKDGDTAIEKLVRSRANVVGAALSNLVDFINPDMVVLGGGLVEAIPGLIRREVRKSIDAHAAKKAARSVKVVTAKLHRHAATVGAALLAIDTMNGHSPIERKAL
jgi:glucokinase